MRRKLTFPACVTLLALAVNPTNAATSAPTPSSTPELSHCLVSLIDEAQVPAQEAGVIVSLKVKEGQIVTKGEVLAQIDDAIPQAEKRKATAEKNAAKEKADSDVEVRYSKAAAGVALYEWKKNLEAWEKAKAVVWLDVMKSDLAHQGADLKIEQAELERRIAALTVDTKSAEVEATEEAIRHRQIKSPLDGVVVQIVPHAGEWMKPGDNVLRIVRMDRLRVEGFLNSAQYSPEDVRDKPVIVTIDRVGQSVKFKGRIVFVSPLDDAGGEFRVWADVDNRLVPGRNDAWLLRPGAQATMTIDLNGQ